VRTSAVGANKHHGDHDASSAVAAADDETNAKTRTINNVDQSRRKREQPVTFTTFRSAKHRWRNVQDKRSRQRKRAAVQAPQREVEDTRKRNNILIHQAPSVKETAGWVGVLDVQCLRNIPELE